ncbi:hypothetical protein GQ457_11G031720 [Hibiscus cannabinus]
MAPEPSVPSEDSRLPKKQRRRDEAPPDSLVPDFSSGMDCDNLGPKPPSYKDMLTGNSDSVVDDDLISLGDDDFDLHDDDIQTGESEGIPFINFSDRVKDLAIKSMDFTLVLKILGRRVGYTTLYNRIIDLWKPTNKIKLIDIENDYYLVKFSSRTDYIHALTDGPWTIFGHYITVEPWSVDFNPLQNYPSCILAWVRLPGLPITWYKRSLIEAIGERIGRVVKIDYQTDFGHRGRFARMAIKINLKKPLVSKITINGQLQFVEYESLPMVCFKCGVYGHVSDSCAPINGGEQENFAQAPSRTMDVPSEPFGPWMLVEKRQRRQPKKVNPGEPPAPPSLAQGSRFNPIFMDDTTVVDTVDQDALQTEVEAAMPEAVNTTVEHESEIAIPQNARESVLKARTKGKATLLIRKPSATVLTPKNLNIMPRKSSSSVPNSSRSKGRNAQPSLNPASHGAVVISTKSAPLIPTQVSPQERDTVRRQSRAQEGIGNLANSMVE